MRKSLSLPAAAALAAILASGCHSLTEFEGTLRAGVVFVRTDDHSVEAVLEGFDDGRAICSIDNSTFYVLGSTGILYKIDSEEMVIDTSFSVWSGLALGPVDIVSPPPRSKLYILGNGPEIIEVGVSSDQVTDIFVAGPSPSCMVTTGSTANSSLYIGDSEDNRLREIDVSTNTMVRSAEIGYQPYTLGIDSSQELLLVSAYFDDAIRLMNISLDPIQAGQVVIQACTDIAFPAGGSHFFIADPDWEGGSGGLYAVSVDTIGGMSIAGRPIPGHPVRLAAAPEGRYLYVLSNSGDGNALLSIIDLFSSGLDFVLELDGYPWDLTMHASGEYVLVLIAN